MKGRRIHASRAPAASEARSSSTHPRPPALVLGGHASALAVTRALGRAGVPIVNIRHEEQGYASASRYVTRQILAPNPVLHPGEYIEALRALGEEYAGALLVPAYDDALLTVAQHHKTLSERFVVSCMEWELTRQVP